MTTLGPNAICNIIQGTFLIFSSCFEIFVHCFIAFCFQLIAFLIVNWAAKETKRKLEGVRMYSFD